ncbi:MAG: class D sortase [Wenzhouxiangellaceae bacterium]|nr:class D sortase [Wenzhouxiangellaceae bacterium]
MIARTLVIVLALAAIWQAAEFGRVQGKGMLGQWLMRTSWAASDEGNTPTDPWPGARTRPVARLFMPELKIDRLVVDGVETPNLAWGPGLQTGANGHTVIAAHRDTHFRFLGDLAPGQHIELEHPAGVIRSWIVDDTRIVDSRTTRLDMEAAGPLLTLVTCWPIDAIESGGPLRLVVTARPKQEGNS